MYNIYPQSILNLSSIYHLSIVYIFAYSNSRQGTLPCILPVQRGGGVCKGSPGNNLTLGQFHSDREPQSLAAIKDVKFSVGCKY